MTKEEKILLALSLIEQVTSDLSEIKTEDESLVTRCRSNLAILGDLVTGRYSQAGAEQVAG